MTTRLGVNRFIVILLTMGGQIAKLFSNVVAALNALVWGSLILSALDHSLI